MTATKAIPGLILFALTGIASAAHAQTGPRTEPGTKPEAQAPAASIASGILTKDPQVIPFTKLPTKKSANGTEGSPSISGTLATGETVALHASTQPAGATPVALHAIHHSELIVIREGNMTYEHDGKSETAGPGDVIYVPFGTTHRVINTGTVPAKYVVIAIGGDTKK